MFEIDARPRRLSTILKEITEDVGDRLESGIRKAAEGIPEIVRLNILTRGAAAGRAYPSTNFIWLRRRKTWPGRRIGPLNATQKSYVKTHTPLLDSQKLFRSFQVMGFERTKATSEMVSRTSSPLKYGRQHELGKVASGGPAAPKDIAAGNAPDRPKKIHRRRHMFITKSDTADINSTIEGEF